MLPDKTPYKYVMISGSYKDDVENDELCELLGTKLSILNIGIINGGNLPGRNVGAGLFKKLLEEDRYEPARIITYYRFKETETKRLVDAFGCVRFFGKTATEMRKEMILHSSALIAIGGDAGTTEEIHLATTNNIPVIPIARSGGFANHVHNVYKKNFYGQFVDINKHEQATFDKLKSEDIASACDAVIALLKSSLNLNEEFQG